MTQFPSEIDLRALLESNDTEAIRRACTDAHPHAVAQRLADLSDDEAWAILVRLEDPQDGEVFAHLPRERQITLATDRDDREVASLLEDMEADDRTDLIQQLEENQAKRLIELLSKEEREETQRLSAYDQDAVGAVMNVDVVRLEPHLTAEQAMARLREQAPRKETIYYAFVVDERGGLIGRVALADLVMAQPAQPVRELMESEPLNVEAAAPRTEAARLIQDYDLVLLPVVEGDNRVVGIVTVDDVMDVVEEEVSDTIYHKAGVGDITHQKDHVWSERLTGGSIWYPVRVRIMYLMIVLVGGFIVGGVVGAYEELLEALVITAVFVPLIMDMGGNVGTQSTTIFARGLALGHIDMKQFFPKFLREGLIGIVMGVILGVLGGTIAYLWQGAPNDVPQLGLAVGIALFSVVTIAAFLGFALPFILVKLGFDHAPGADPFVTTIKDFTGLLIYFGVVAAIVPIDWPDEEQIGFLLESGRQLLAVTVG